MDLLRYFEKKQIVGVERPVLKAGDIVRVETKVQDGETSRLQAFEGTVLGIRGSGPSTTFTVRRETGGFGVERVFPLYSPLIQNIVIVKRQKVRRAKLLYLRQMGRRRFAEDVKSMQRLIKEEGEKKRLAEDKVKREAEAQAKEERKKIAAEKAAAEAKEEQKEVSTEGEKTDEAQETGKAESTDKSEAK